MYSTGETRVDDVGAPAGTCKETRASIVVVVGAVFTLAAPASLAVLMFHRSTPQAPADPVE